MYNQDLADIGGLDRLFLFHEFDMDSAKLVFNTINLYRNAPDSAYRISYFAESISNSSKTGNIFSGTES